MDHQIGKQEKDQFIIILFVLLGLSLLLAVASVTMWKRNHEGLDVLAVKKH